MKFKKKYIGFLAFLFILAAAFFVTPEKKAEAAQAPKKLSSLTAVYTGDSVLVGNTIDLTKLTVMGLYSDGSYVKMKDYVLSTYMVTKSGANEIVVSYEGVNSTFYVYGKSITGLVAYYADTSATVGEILDRKKITVHVYYSDGTHHAVTDFELSHSVVGKIGENEYVVSYGGKTTKFSVTGKALKKPKMLYAAYNGPAVIVGNSPKREDFNVSVLYTDNSIEPTSSFELTPAIVQKEGTNIMIVSYGGISADVRVTGIPKTVVSIVAEYTGLPVVVGKSVAAEDIKVTATFNDGSKDVVTNFTLSSSVIYRIGENILTVFCDNTVAFVNVRGVEAEIIDFDNSAQAVVRNGDDYSRIILAVGTKADPKQVTIEELDPELVKKAMNRLVRTDKYIVFDVSFEDPEMDLFLPMTMRVTMPKGYDKENFAVFYTPNKKTIMGQMNGEFVTSTTYEFKMFQPGTYIIADCTPLIYVETLALEEETITLKVGRSYSLDPEILPHTATNKEVTYTSTRPQIVSVSKYGTIKGLKPGTSIVTVEATDGSGKRTKVRVNVVNKKGKFDDEIAQLSDRVNEISTAEDFLDFLDYLVEDIAEKAEELTRNEFLVYGRELESWTKSWDEETIALEPGEWAILWEMLYMMGEYDYGAILCGDTQGVETALERFDKQIAEIKTEEDFQLFAQMFFTEYEEKEYEWETEEQMLYLIGLQNRIWEIRDSEEFLTNWDEKVWDAFEEWASETELLIYG